MNPLIRNYHELLEQIGPEPEIRAGDDFAGQVLARLESRLQKQHRPGGFVRAHANQILLAVTVLVNLVSIGIGLRSIRVPSPDVKAETTVIYFIDTSDSQLYNHFK